MPYTHLYLLLAILFFSANIQAQELKPFSSKGKCGYKNANGEIVVPAEYDDCRDCFLGENYKIVISGGKKNNNILKGWEDGKWGVIHASGKTIVPVEYDYINYLNDKAPGIIKAVSVGKFSFFDTIGKVILPLADDITLGDNLYIFFREYCYYVRGFIPYKLNGKYGVVDFKGNTLIEPQCDCISNFTDEKGKSPQLSVFGINGKLGVLYSNGEVIAAVFDALYDANEGGISDVNNLKARKSLSCSLSSISPNATARNIYGIIGDSIYLFNHEGKQIPSFYLNNSTIVNEKFIISEINGKYGVVNTQTEIIIPYSYDEIKFASTDKNLPVEKRNLVFVGKLEDKWGAFSSEGKEIIPFVYDELKANYKNKYCAAFAGRKANEWVLFDIAHQFKSNWIEGKFYESKWGILNNEDDDRIYSLDGNCKLDYLSKSGNTFKTLHQSEAERIAEKYKQERSCPTCTHCEGTGLDRKKEYILEKCYSCQGSGTWTAQYGYGKNVTYKKYSCYTCTGSGSLTKRAEKKPCFFCKGKGCIAKD